MIDSLVRSAKRVRRVVLVAVLLSFGLATASLLSACSGGTGEGSTPTSVDDGAVQREPVTHEFVIPDGTSVRVKKGEETGVIPRQIDINVGDRIQIRNEDSETARLGIFDVGAGETVTMDFNEVNVLTGTIFGDEPAGCGQPPPENKKFVINVRP